MTVDPQSTPVSSVRRWLIGVLVVVVLAAGTAVALVLVPHLRGSSTSGGTRRSGPLSRTVDLVRNDAYVAAGYTSHVGIQILEVHSTNGGLVAPWTAVIVHDPGTFGTSAMETGEPVTVRGHRAYLVRDLLIGDVKAPTVFPGANPASVTAIGWPEPDGEWVVVAEPVTFDPLNTVRAVADLVRVSRPRPMTAPFQLRDLPTGLVPRSADSADLPNVPPLGGYRSASVTLDHTAQPPKIVVFGPNPVDHGAVNISVSSISTTDPSGWGEPTKLGGLDGWLLTGKTSSQYRLRHDSCLVMIEVPAGASVATNELGRMVQTAKFTNCTDPQTWIGPIVAAG
jgi:hypothetical protein